MVNYSIVDGADGLKIAEVMGLLKQTYWADKRPAEQVQRSMENSRCCGVRLEDGTLAAFARVISDYATTYYLCDVVVAEEHRGKGLGYALVSYFPI